MRPATFYKLIIGLALTLITIASVLVFTGCAKEIPTSPPAFENFDMEGSYR